MKKYPDFWTVVIGKGPVGILLGFVAVAFVCALVSLLIQASNRDVHSDRTPTQFSWKFWFADNSLRLIANLMVLPIAIRLLYESVPMEGMLLLSVGLGFGVDKLAALAQQYGILTTSKIAAKMKDKIEGSDSK